MFSAIISALGGKFVDSLFSNLRGALKDYQERKISELELKVRVSEALLTTARESEKAHADLIAKTYDSFQRTLRTSPVMQIAWCWVVYTQLAVLLWHQIGIPLVTLAMQSYVSGWKYPSSGSTVEWAYALLGFMFGAGAMLLRTGPGKGDDLLTKVKSVIGR